MGPQGFGGSGDKGYMFSGSWEALLIIFRDLGSNLIVPQKVKTSSKNVTLKEMPIFRLTLKKKKKKKKKTTLFISMVVINQIQ